MDIRSIDRNTLLKDILAAYPWLSDVLPQEDKRFEQLNSPLGKIFLRKATIADLGKKAGRTPEELISELERIIREHDAEA